MNDLTYHDRTQEIFSTGVVCRGPRFYARNRDEQDCDCLHWSYGLSCQWLGERGATSTARVA